MQEWKAQAGESQEKGRKRHKKPRKGEEKGEIRSEKLRAGVRHEKGRKRHKKPRKRKEKAKYAVKS